MKVIRRLYIFEFLKLLGLLVAGMSLLFSLIEIAGGIKAFLPERTSPSRLAMYALYNLPRFIPYLLPMAVLISGMFIFSQASRRKEIVAIKAAGGRLRRLFYPFIALGLLLCLLSFLIGEFIAPSFSKKAQELNSYLEGKEKKVVFEGGRLWLRGNDGSPVKIEVFNTEKKMAQGISIFLLTEKRMKEKITADRAVWDGTTWILEKVTRYQVEKGRIQHLASMPYAGLESPDLFSQELKAADEMNIAELYQYMQRLKNAGFRNIKPAVDINSKISFPLITAFMMLLGISLSMKMALGGGFLSAGLGLILSLVYGFSYTFFLSMGYAGILHPLVSAWIMPALFSLLSIYLFLTIPE